MLISDRQLFQVYPKLTVRCVKNFYLSMSGMYLLRNRCKSVLNRLNLVFGIITLLYDETCLKPTKKTLKWFNYLESILD